MTRPGVRPIVLAGLSVMIAAATSLLGVSACTQLRSHAAPTATAQQTPTPATTENPATATARTAPPAANTQPSTSAPPAAPGANRSPQREGSTSRPASPPVDKPKPATAGTPTPSTPAAPASNTRAPERTDTTPTLDMAALEKRLRDTSAIGLFTKLSLKNQVDELLQQFRGYHSKRTATPLSELRQRYESLLNKVLGLLQSGDPDLAKAVSASREAIWGILTDPQKFAAI
jgi:hypothetical protein